jgi:uroporphyrinogen decarboxylase
MQSGREAIDKLIRKQRADHVPQTDGPWSDALRKWVTQGMPSDEKGEPTDPATHFGYDMACCGGWFDWQPKRGFSEVVQETDEWKLVRNGSGAVLKWWKNKSGTPEHVDFHMTSRDIWEREYKPLLAPFDRERLGKVDELRERLAKRRGEGKWSFYGSTLIWENMRASMGDYAMYMALVDDPGWIRDYCRTYVDFYKQCYGLLIEEVGKPDGFWLYEDLGYKDRLFCSPEVLESLIFPFFKEMVDFFHSYGLPVILHSCGFQEAALPLIVQAGFDGLHPMEVKAGNDIFKFAERYGDRLMFVGGLDERILETHDRAAIRKGVTAFMQGMKSRGARFVYGSDHSLSTNIDYQDYLFSLEVYRENAQLI